jgi:hypothetical protein
MEDPFMRKEALGLLIPGLVAVAYLLAVPARSGAG